MNSDTHVSVEPPQGIFSRRRRRLSAVLGEGLALLYRGDAPFFEDLHYLTGLSGYESAALVDLTSGRHVAWTWRFDPPPLGDIDATDVRVSDDSWEAAVEELALRSPTVVYVGLRGPNVASRFQQLHEKCPRAALLDVEPVVGRLRMVKDAWELHCLARARDAAAAVMATVRNALRAGTAEVEAAALIVSELVCLGANRPSVPIVAFGENTADLHHVPAGRRLQRGDVVLIDVFGEAHRHYCCEHTDTFVFEGANPAAERRIAVVERTLAALQAMAQPGATLVQLERVAGGLLAQGGFGAEYPGVCAHDVGLSEHDPTDKSVPLSAGRVVAIEPSVYSASSAVGVRVERTLTISIPPESPQPLS